MNSEQWWEHCSSLIEDNTESVLDQIKELAEGRPPGFKYRGYQMSRFPCPFLRVSLGLFETHKIPKENVASYWKNLDELDWDIDQLIISPGIRIWRGLDCIRVKNQYEPKCRQQQEHLAQLTGNFKRFKFYGITTRPDSYLFLPDYDMLRGL